MIDDKTRHIKFPSVTCLKFTGSQLYRSQKHKPQNKPTKQLTVDSPTQFHVVNIPHQLITISAKDILPKKTVNSTMYRIRHPSLTLYNPLKIKTLSNQLPHQIYRMLSLSYGIKVNNSTNINLLKAVIIKCSTSSMVKSLLESRGWQIKVVKTSKQVDLNEDNTKIQYNLVWSETVDKSLAIECVQKSSVCFRDISNEQLVENNYEGYKNNINELNRLSNNENYLKLLVNKNERPLLEWKSKLKLTKSIKVIETHRLTIYNHLQNEELILNSNTLYHLINQNSEKKHSKGRQIMPITFYLSNYNWQENLTLFRTNCKYKQWIIKNNNHATAILSPKQTYNAVLLHPPKSEQVLIIQQFMNPILFNESPIQIFQFLLAIQIDHEIKFYQYHQMYAQFAQKRQKSTKEQTFTLKKTPFFQIMPFLNQKYGLQQFQIIKNVNQITQTLCESISIIATGKGLCFSIFTVCFELGHLGKPYLVDIKTPQLDFSCLTLNQIAQQMIRNCLALILDLLWTNPVNNLTQNNFTLMYQTSLKRN